MVESSRKKLDPETAEIAALDFAARAAHRELVLHAEYSDCPEMVKPADRSLYDAMMKVVHIERRVALELLRFAWDAVRVAFNEFPRLLG